MVQKIVPCTGYLGNPADTCTSTDAPFKLGSTRVELVLVMGQDCDLCLQNVYQQF